LDDFALSIGEVFEHLHFVKELSEFLVRGGGINPELGPHFPLRLESMIYESEQQLQPMLQVLTFKDRSTKGVVQRREVSSAATHLESSNALECRGPSLAFGAAVSWWAVGTTLC